MAVRQRYMLLIIINIILNKHVKDFWYLITSKGKSAVKRFCTRLSKHFALFYLCYLRNLPDLWEPRYLSQNVSLTLGLFMAPQVNLFS